MQEGRVHQTGKQLHLLNSSYLDIHVALIIRRWACGDKEAVIGNRKVGVRSYGHSLIDDHPH